MQVDFNKFVNWANTKFNNVIVKKDQVRINSIFEKDDDGHHLWCSPSGGKKQRPFGVFHCFKTEEKGNLLKLVKLVEKCDTEEAIFILTGRKTIAHLEKELEELLKSDDNYNLENEIKKPSLNLPVGSSLISALPINNWWRQKATEYLNNRKIPIDDLYICKEDPYKGRIIIPYYDRDGNLIYFNGRHINPKAGLRYLGPPITCGTGKEDVIFMAGSWPISGETVYVCEGEFNALSLKISGLNSCACGGKNLSEKQAILLSDYRLVFCLDRDKAGASGLKKMVELMKRFSHKNSSFQMKCTQPPAAYNDWNQMLIAVGTNVLREFVVKTQKIVDFDAPSGMAGDIFDI